MKARVADIMNPKLLYVREGDRLAMVRSKILAFGVTAVPVLDEDHRPVGVVSLRDFDRDGEVEPSSPVRVVRGDMTVTEGARVLADSGMHHLVVVDDRGVAIGMVSAVDFLRALVGAPPSHPAAFAAF
ncbi:MAG: CBS domain-containing protein [Labilithrix sp.]|nr:CBS domain-containing protein [Labilithrix sp.]MCW5812536.1 CBS domain-containing protein [Labilithrix sp.]